MHNLFVSDLHLDATRPGKISLFLEFLEAAARRVHTLYILGDLFEAWAGDDDLREPHGRILAALARATGSGLNIYFMRGNRDLLIGEAFALRTGCRLLADPHVLELDGVRILLSHGDKLCTDDHGYQLYRRIVGLRGLQALFLALPLRLRQHTVSGMRKGMHRPGRIVDAAPAAVHNILRKYQAHTLIHGHTHLEGTHTLELDGRITTRYVLGDWYRKDSLLEWHPHAPRLLRVHEWLNN